MIALELKNSTATVRIHDEYCQTPTERSLEIISDLISESYKRRCIGTECMVPSSGSGFEHAQPM